MNRMVYSVVQLNRYIKALMEDDPLLSGIFIEGELSNFKRHSSGHLYFTLKDAYAAVSCVMFRSNAENVAFAPESGMRVVLFGRVSLYEKTGQYQFYAEDMEPWGKGGLYLAFEQMKAKLESEGLFARKRPIPKYPASIAVITSPTGAAVRDIINISTRRNKNVTLTVIPALVQGERAAASIVEAIELANRTGADILILARGGGSFEDLWPFCEEAVARAIYKSAIPVVSAVGHETDYCIADFVADLRAPTPSAAAELCVPETDAVAQGLRQRRIRIEQAMERRIETTGHTLNMLSRRISSKALLESVYSRQIYAEQIFARATRIMSHKTELSRMRLRRVMDAVELVSPTSVLKRGYALVYGEGGLKTSAGGVSPGERLELHFHDGVVKAAEKP